MAYQLVRLMPGSIFATHIIRQLVLAFVKARNKNMPATECARGETKADVFAFITKKVNSLEVHSSLSSHFVYVTDSSDDQSTTRSRLVCLRSPTCFCHVAPLPFFYIHAI